MKFDAKAQRDLLNQITFAKAIYMRAKHHKPTLYQNNEIMSTLTDRIASMQPQDVAMSIITHIYAEILYPLAESGDYLHKADEYIARTKDKKIPTN